MAKHKLQRFKELETFQNVFQNHDHSNDLLTNSIGQHVNFRGQWAEKFFHNNHPIVLELACGKGEYAIGLAKKNPNTNYIGIDVKGARIWRGAKTALEMPLGNVAFARIRIDHLDRFFGPGEISEIWITFADPHLNNHDAEKRLTSSRFIYIYRKVCKAGAMIHLKTDSLLLYNSTIESLSANHCTILENNDDIYSSPLSNEDLQITTFYERMHLAKKKTIKYLRFTL